MRFKCIASRQKLMTTSMARSEKNAARETFRRKTAESPKNSSAFRENTTRKGIMELAGTSEAFRA